MKIMCFLDKLHILSKVNLNEILKNKNEVKLNKYATN